MKKFLKTYRKYIIAVAVILAMALVFMLGRCSNNGKKLDEVEYVDSSKTYHKQYYEGGFQDLKKENKVLYDSLKKYKDQIDFVLQFDYDKTYHTGKVITKSNNSSIDKTFKTTNTSNINEAKTYEYGNKPNDSIEYKLKINSYTEPNWYSLDFKLHDKVTVVNKDQGNGINHLTVNTSNKADVSNTTVMKKKRKKSIFNKIAIGPTVGYGYTFKSKKIEPYIGISVTCNIFGTK